VWITVGSHCVTLRKVSNAWAHYETAGPTYKLLSITALTIYSLAFIKST
jgi:hypothetical protein